ncbi:unnamed protein product [Lymnaea stagnalis]|uniref:Uncharacterized protein n=1 Tax=Lymnaea stagnalis TaxID=6523 RepID=A0AAV2H5P7_LYMST
MPRDKCALRRGTPHWPELEKHAKDQNCTKIPADLDCKVINFLRYVIKQPKKRGYALSQIENLDETPMKIKP